MQLFYADQLLDRRRRLTIYKYKYTPHVILFNFINFQIKTIINLFVLLDTSNYQTSNNKAGYDLFQLKIFLKLKSYKISILLLS